MLGHDVTHNGDAGFKRPVAPFMCTDDSLGHKPTAVLPEAAPSAGILGHCNAWGELLGEYRNELVEIRRHGAVHAPHEFRRRSEIVGGDVKDRGISPIEVRRVVEDLQPASDACVIRVAGRLVNE